MPKWPEWTNNPKIRVAAIRALKLLVYRWFTMLGVTKFALLLILVYCEVYWPFMIFVAFYIAFPLLIKDLEYITDTTEPVVMGIRILEVLSEEDLNVAPQVVSPEVTVVANADDF